MEPTLSLSLSLRKEVLHYLRSCDDLLTALSQASTPRFSEEELDVLEYTVAELQKVLVVCAKPEHNIVS